MVAQARERRTGPLAGAVGIALLLVGLTLLLEPASRRAAAAVLLGVGLAVGVLVALRVPASARLRTPMERLNDGAFLVVVSAVALVAVRLARPWTAALPGLVGGVLIGLTLRPRPAQAAAPPGAAEAPAPDAGPRDHAGPPARDAEPPVGERSRRGEEPEG
jgi:hypothetical protein